MLKFSDDCSEKVYKVTQLNAYMQNRSVTKPLLELNFSRYVLKSEKIVIFATSKVYWIGIAVHLFNCCILNAISTYSTALLID